MEKTESHVSYSSCSEDSCVRQKNIFKNESKYDNYNRCGKKAKDIYKNIRKSKKSFESFRTNVTESASKEKLDSIRSGESLIKKFIFEPTKHSNDTEKCIAFWEYIRNREDLKPVKSTLIKGITNQKKGNDADTQTIDTIECDWYKALLELKKKKLDKLAMSTALPACKLCNQKLFEEEYFQIEEDEKSNILTLSDWDPYRKTYVDVATQHSTTFTDNWNDTQDTESFKNLCKAAKERFVDKSTDVQRYESLMRIKKKVHLQVNEQKNKVHMIGDEYPLQKICKCKSKAIEITKCPYNVPKCTCSINEGKQELEQTACPYHVPECICGQFNSESELNTNSTCLYNVSKCVCSETETEIMFESNQNCPYHIADCDCSIIKQKDSNNEAVKILFEAKPKVVDEALNCICESINGELTCSCSDDEEIEEIRAVEAVVLCPYKFPSCNCADEEPSVTSSTKIPVEQPKKLLKAFVNSKSVGVQAKMKEKYVKLPNKLCFICGLLNCNCLKSK